jgi:hypothetical protein
MKKHPQNPEAPLRQSPFIATQWSVVLAAQGDDSIAVKDALTERCQNCS